jgi:hypothetical protein
MADIKKSLDEVLANYVIKETVNTKDKITKLPVVRYVVIVPKFVKAGDKKRTDHQIDIEESLKKKLGNALFKKSVNLNGRVPIPGSKNFLATTIDDTKTTYLIGLKEEANALNLLPGKINPKNPVVGVWLTAKEMKDRILDHIDSNTSISDKDKQSYHDLLDDAIKPSTNPIKYTVPKNENNAEFFELVSAINLASLLKVKNNYITDTLLDMPDKYKSILGKKPIKIYIPTSSTFALLDFFIDFRGVSSSSSYKQEGKEARSLKISVKAKLGAAKPGKEATGDTNTIKFKDLFNSKLKNVDRWYNELSKWSLTDLKKQQYGPKQIAYYGVESDINTNIGTLYPIKALGQLLSKGSDKSKMKKQLAKTLVSFGQRKIGNFSLKTKYTNDEVSDAFTEVIIDLSPKIQNYRKDDPLKSTMVTNPESLKIVLTTLPLILETTKVKPKDVKLNVANVGVICERILQNSSDEKSETKYNFYYMFYDQVLEKKHIIYSVPTRFGPDQLKFKYLAAANWLQEYKDWQGDIQKAWISLRGKSNANHLGDYGALGISV